MFNKLDLSDWDFLDGDANLGLVKCNLLKIKKDKFTPLFTRINEQYKVKQVGRVDYNYLDSFIIKSLNDYYQKINVGDEEQRHQKALVYQRLYSSWNDILKAKKNPNIEVNELYDAIVYELYLIGYKE